MSKAIQIVLLLFIFGVVAAIPFLLGNVVALSSMQTTTSSELATQVANGVQEIRIHASPQGYSLTSFAVKKGVPVKILFSADKYAGCGRQLIMREFGVNLVVQASETLEAQFTPMQEGTFAYRCSMDMFKGRMTVTT